MGPSAAGPYSIPTVCAFRLPAYASPCGGRVYVCGDTAPPEPPGRIRTSAVRLQGGPAHLRSAANWGAVGWAPNVSASTPGAPAGVYHGCPPPPLPVCPGRHRSLQSDSYGAFLSRGSYGGGGVGPEYRRPGRRGRRMTDQNPRWSRPGHTPPPHAINRAYRMAPTFGPSRCRLRVTAIRL